MVKYINLKDEKLISFHDFKPKWSENPSYRDWIEKNLDEYKVIYDEYVRQYKEQNLEKSL